MTGSASPLAVDGVYLVSGLSFTAHHLTVDFRGARLVGAQHGSPSVLRIQTSSDVVLNDPWVVGTVRLDPLDPVGARHLHRRRLGHHAQPAGHQGPATHGDGIYVGMFHDGTQLRRPAW
ncbi:MAG: hypothetical protein U0869_01245 [Chloroflexota bacterium]